MSVPAGPSFALKAWMHRQQDGRCYLQITHSCRKANGVMVLAKGNSDGRIHDKRFATWEHLLPKRSPIPKGLKRRNVLLLACVSCNHKKGDARLCTPEQVEFALVLARIWMRFGCGASGSAETAFREIGEAYTVGEDGAVVIARPLPVNLDLPVDGKVIQRVLMAGGAWIKRDGVKVAMAAVPPHVEPHPYLPPAGYSPSMTERLKQQRAAENKRGGGPMKRSSFAYKSRSAR